MITGQGESCCRYYSGVTCRPASPRPATSSSSCLSISCQEVSAPSRAPILLALCLRGTVTVLPGDVPPRSACGPAGDVPPRQAAVPQFTNFFKPLVVSGEANSFPLLCFFSFQADTRDSPFILLYLPFHLLVFVFVLALVKLTIPLLLGVCAALLAQCGLF